MGSDIVSHNTGAMRNWSSNMTSNAEEYDALINRLYSLIEEFTSSSDFSGGLSTDFYNAVVEKKSAFMSYSATFRECADLINKRASRIDSNEADLKNRFNNANPLG